MREILFRGKTVGEGNWIFGAYLPKHQLICIEENKPNSTEFIDLFVIPETVGQYTGLTDTNGTKIFEGDILQIITGDGWSCPKGTKVNYEVVFTDFNPQNATWSEYIGYMAKRQKGGLSSLVYVVNSYGAVVVGNIYDNPELLGGK